MGCDEVVPQSSSEGVGVVPLPGERYPRYILKHIAPSYRIAENKSTGIRTEVKPKCGPMFPRAIREKQRTSRLLIQKTIERNLTKTLLGENLTPTPTGFFGDQMRKRSALKRLENLSLATEDSSSSSTAGINALNKDLANSTEEPAVL